jgi:hypothetical protein
MISTDNVVPFNRPEPEPVGFAQASKAWLWPWFTDRRLTSGETKICQCIFLHFNSDHFKETGDLLAWPEWETIMNDANLKRSCVHKGLRRLKELGAFEVEHGPYDHEKKKRGSNRYIVRTSKVHAGGPSKGKQGPLSKELGPRKAQSKVHADSTVSGEYGSGESRSKKEENLKNGLPRGPSAPEKESKPSSTDSPKPSLPLRSACEVPPPTAALPAEFQKWLGGLPRMPRPRPWDQHREASATLERYRQRAGNGSGGKTMAVSS